MAFFLLLFLAVPFAALPYFIIRKILAAPDVISRVQWLFLLFVNVLLCCLIGSVVLELWQADASLRDDY